MMHTEKSVADMIAADVRASAKCGNRNVPKMIRQIDDLRKAIRAEGTPAIQSAWDAVEEHIDYAYRRGND